MTTARAVITSALTTQLNRLSPGEALDADLASLMLTALNEISDDISGSGSFLFREQIYTAAGLTGTSFTTTATWPGIDFGQEIVDASYNQGTFDYPIAQITMEQYFNEIRIKTLSGGLPQFWAYDGADTIYFYPAASGLTIKLFTKQSLANFADLDTDYSLPQGYQSYLSAQLAERVAPAVVGGLPPAVAMAAKAARHRMAAQLANPGIISGTGVKAGNIFTGFR